MNTEKEERNDETTGTATATPTVKHPRAEISPLYTVEESADGYTLTLELPGVDTKDINLEIENRTLSVTAENTVGAYEGYAKVIREAPEVRYRASFDLPEQVDGEAVKASRKNGLLILTLPKRAAVKPRKIEIG
ncbi:MAG: Hsp20/alpha crystallin family protein [Kiritimatiellae bacterium]|nr:Hsp20/alpha crystallin family protein [Kiritimatiellia bacterium]